MTDENDATRAPLAEVIETSGAAVIGITPEGLVSSWNDAAEELYGFHATEIVGRPLANITPNGGSVEWAKAFDNALLGERSDDIRVTRRLRDGTTSKVPVQLHALRAIDTPSLTDLGTGLRDEPGDAAFTPDVVPDWYHGLPVTVFVLDLDGRFHLCAGPGLRTAGISPEDVLGMSVFDFLDDEAKTMFNRALAGEAFTVSTKVGDQIWETTFSPVLRDGELAGCTGCALDVTSRWRNEEALAVHESRYRALVQNSTDVMAVMADDTKITYVSPSVTALLGYTPEEIEGESLLDYLHPDDYFRVAGRFQRVLENTHESYTIEARLLHKDGSWRHYEAVHTDFVDSPAVSGIIINGRDISDRIEGAQRLERLALEDPLTGLPNRALLLDRVQQLMDLDTPDTVLAAIVLDVDLFRVVNDSLGHTAGDELLNEIAMRLSTVAGSGDTVARLGADTFVVLTRAANEAAAAALAGELIAVLREPADIAGTRLTVTASAGVALDLGDFEMAEDLIRDADAAMYVAKEKGRDRVEVFTESQRDRAMQRLRVEQELREGIERGELRVHYQPVMSISSNRPTGVEALVRWEHPDRGMVPPGAFIPLAEETGLIVQLGEFVLKEACRQVANWVEQGLDLHVSVNLSPRQLIKNDFAKTVEEALEGSGLPPGRLVLEVTESVLVDEAAAVNRVLDALYDLGVSLAIDDFGTGYSSLVTLRRLRVDTLKIDRSFVDGLGSDAEDDAIVDAVITLGKALGLRIVAEGVETEHQHEELRKRGCDDAQGFLYHRPVAPHDLAEWFTSALS